MSAVEPGSVTSIFTDSLEVYSADWTADLPAEFKKRRGYDLLPLLPLLEYDEAPRSDAVRHDFGKTLTELFEERFLIPMHEWSVKNKVLFRMQDYGIPPARLSSQQFVDIADGEGFHWRSLETTRWASSANSNTDTDADANTNADADTDSTSYSGSDADDIDLFYR